HPEDLKGYWDEDDDLQSAWDDLLEPPTEEAEPPTKEKPFEVLTPDVFYMCRYAANVSQLTAKKIHAHLRQLFGEDTYASWFASLEFYSFNYGVLIATVPVKFLKNWINEHYGDDLMQVCSEEFEGLERVEVVLRHPGMSRTP